MLSGFGCYLSIGKAKKIVTWYIEHVIKMLICFVIVFIFVLEISLYQESTFASNEWLRSFFTLKIPGTTSWYFKVQILFYGLLALSERIRRRQCYLISMFIFAYAIMANFFELSDFWWKTSMCFAEGCILAEYKEQTVLIIEKTWIKLIFIFLGCAAYTYTLIASYYICIPQLFAYILISTCIIVIWDWIIRENAAFEMIGKASLEIYLIHIGIASLIFETSVDIDEKMIMFVTIIIIGTILCNTLYNWVCEHLLKKYIRSLHN